MFDFILCGLLPRVKCAYKVINRTKTFSNIKFPSYSSPNYQRKVLQNAKDCILFDSSHNYSPTEHPIHNDALILKVINVARDFKSGIKITHQKLEHLDKECLQTSKRWSMDRKLFTIDIWYSLQRFNSEFIFVTLKDLLKHLDDFSKDRTMQILYYAARTKQQIQHSGEKKIINKLDEVLDSSSLDEVSIYCSVLVRLNGKSRDEYVQFVERFFHFLMNIDLKNENERAVNDALKALRRLSTVHQIKNIKALQPKLIALVEKGAHYTVTHCALLGFQQRVYDQRLLETALQRSIELMDQLRSKDVERMLLLISTYNLETSDRIKDQFCLRAQQRIKQFIQNGAEFPSSIIHSIASLAIEGTANPELVEWALKFGDSSRNERGHNFILTDDMKHLLMIDSFAKINLSETYNGHVLPETICSEMKLKAYARIEDGFISSVINDLLEIFKLNNHKYLLTKVVPHSARPDIILLYNKRTKSTIEILNNNQTQNIFQASDLHRNDPDLMAVALVTFTQRYTLFNSHRFIGSFQMKLNQLERLGFDVVMLPIVLNKWKNFIGMAAKQEYLHTQLCRKQIFLFSKQ